MSNLTVVIPTRDRPGYVASQLRFFKGCGLRHRLVVADESNPDRASRVKEACAGIAEYRHFDPAAQPTSWLCFADKILQVLRMVDTPYVVLCPDDDITFPHAIDASLGFLERNGDFLAARGYWLTCDAQQDDFFIDQVASFTPSIEEEIPLRRVYQLMSRYQPFVWSVFRTETLACALAASMAVDGVLFQEIMFMNAAILRGKVARLPVIFGMSGTATSLTPPTQTHPWFWFSNDSDAFFEHYARYRDALARDILELGIPAPPEAGLKHLLNMIHAVWLAPEFDRGRISHTAQQLLGYRLPDVTASTPMRELGTNTFIHPSATSGRRYIWNASLIPPHLVHEIQITAHDMVQAESQLDHYHLL